MFSSLLKKITDAIDGPTDPKVSGGALGGAATAAKGGGSCMHPVGASTLTEGNAEWADVYNHNVGIADSLKKYVKSQQQRTEAFTKQASGSEFQAAAVIGRAFKKNPLNEECCGDYDGKVLFRADAAVGSPFANARIVAYDSTRQLMAVLTDPPTLTIASSTTSSVSSFGLSSSAPTVSNRTTGASCVYIVGYGGSVEGGKFATPLQEAILVRDNEDWEEMTFVEGYHVLVLRSSRMLCFVDTRSFTSQEVRIREDHYMLPLYLKALPGKDSCGASLTPPLSANGNAGPLLTRLCKQMPIGLGSIAVGTSDGKVLFAPLFPPSKDTPMVWRKAVGDVRSMLETSKIGHLLLARSATQRHFETQYLSAKQRYDNSNNDTNDNNPHGAALPPLSMAHLLDSVEVLVSYPSDPNAYLTSTRNSHGILKWYLVENRLSAMLLLPHCYAHPAGCRSGGLDSNTLRSASPSQMVGTLGSHFESTFVTAAAVTNGGGFVIGLTNTFTLVVWHEKEDKRSGDKSVPPMSVMDLLLSHPLANCLGSLPDNQSASDEDEDPVNFIDSARYAHRILLSKPRDMYVMGTVSPLSYALLTETALSASCRGVAESGVPTGAAPQQVMQEPSFLTVFIPTQQVQFSGSDITASLPTEHSSVMTEIRLDASTMHFITVRHVPVQGHRDSLSYHLHTKNRGYPYTLFPQYPVAISTVPVIPNGQWGPDRVCGLLLGVGAGVAQGSASSLASTADARMSVNVSGGVGGADLRGSVRGSVVLASSVCSNASNNPQLLASIADIPPPLAHDGSPMSLASFLMCATATRDVVRDVRGLPNDVQKNTDRKVRITVRVRSPIGGHGVSILHRVVDRFAINEEEGASAATSLSSYYNASYASVCIDFGVKEAWHSPHGAGHGALAGADGEGNNTHAQTTNKLLLFTPRHRRLMYDREDALRTRAAGRVAGAKNTSQGNSSTSAAYLLGGGGRNPFRYVIKGRRPHKTEGPDDTPLMALFTCMLRSGSQLIAAPSQTQLMRLYPLTNQHAMVPPMSILQILQDTPCTPPAPARPQQNVSSSVSLYDEERVIGTPQLVFDGTIILSLIERRSFVSLSGGGGTSRCSLSYHLKVTTQRFLSDGEEGAGDSDADNDEYENVTVPSPTASTGHNQIFSVGTVPIPYIEALLPMCCAGYHASMVDEEGYVEMPTPSALHSAAAFTASQAQSTVPTIALFRVIYGRMLKKPSANSKGPNRLFSPNEGLSVLMVLSENTVIIMAITDLIALQETVCYRKAFPSSSSSSQDALPTSESMVLIPAFLFPAQARIKSADVFSVPIVVPSGWGGADQPASNQPNAQVSSLVPSLPSASLFASAHSLVLSVGLSDGSLLLFDACREAVISCTAVLKGSCVASLVSCTPANGVYSYSPATDEAVDIEDDAASASSSRLTPPTLPLVALTTNPFAPQNVNKTNVLHDEVYEPFTIPAYGGSVSGGGADGGRRIHDRPLYCWYPRSCFSKIPPQFPVGCVDAKGGSIVRRGQKGASTGGCSYFKMEVLFAGGMLTFADILAKALPSVAEGKHTYQVKILNDEVINLFPLLTIHLLDIIGLPICGVEMAIGIPAGGLKKGPATLFLRLGDTTLFARHNLNIWAPIHPKRLASLSGLAVTRELDTGLGIISALPMPGSKSDADDAPEVIFTTKASIPIGISHFNTRRISCVNIHVQTAVSAATNPFIFSHTQGSNISIEIVDALDESIRLFGVDVMPMPVIGGSQPLGGVVSSIVSEALARKAGGPHVVPARARVPQMPSLHDFPLSRNFSTTASPSDAAGSGASARRPAICQLSAIAPSRHQMSVMSALIANCNNPKTLVSSLEAALEAVAPNSPHQQYHPSTVATVTTGSSATNSSRDAAIIVASLKQCIYAVQANSINWVRSHIQSLMSCQSPPQPPQSIPIPPPTFSSQLSLRSLLCVAVRHNNLCEKGLSEWARSFSGVSGAANLLPSKSTSKPAKRLTFEERMKRVEKGLPPEPVDEALSTAGGSDSSAGIDSDTAANCTIDRLYRGPNQTQSDSVSSKCPYFDFLLPNVVAAFTVTSTSAEPHDADELIAVRLGHRVDKSEAQREGGFDADEDEDGLGQLAHVPVDRQRPYVFVAFTTETNTSNPYCDEIVDCEEGLYGHKGLFGTDEEGVYGETKGEDAPETLVHCKGIARQGGMYRHQIAVFDVSMASFAAEQQATANGRSLAPLFVYSVPCSVISSFHILSGFDVCWLQGQAHCYLTSCHPSPRVEENVVELAAIASPITTGFHSLNAFRHSKGHDVAHIVLDDGAKDIASQEDQPRGRQCPPTQLSWGGTCMGRFNSFSTCDFVGVSLARKREMEAQCAVRAAKEIEQCKAQTSAMAFTGRPPLTGKELIGTRIPNPPPSMQASQKEQSFFKRLTANSYPDQLEKVEKSALAATSEVDFNSFFATAQSAALRNLTPAERRALLLETRRAASASASDDLRSSRAQSTQSGINETKSVMNENLQLLNERGEKIDRLKLKTREMHEEAATFAELAAQLKAKQRSRWF